MDIKLLILLTNLASLALFFGLYHSMIARLEKAKREIKNRDGFLDLFEDGGTADNVLSSLWKIKSSCVMTHYQLSHRDRGETSDGAT